MQHSSSYPKFAVVGHPNKGKSSIVSTLALDNTVQVGNTPGTTQVKRSFPLRVDNRVVYELFDTPGFQRARRVLAWLQEHEPVIGDRELMLSGELWNSIKMIEGLRKELEEFGGLASETRNLLGIGRPWGIIIIG